MDNGCKIIAVTGNPRSWLATFGDAHLTAAVTNEGGPLNRAPRTFILAETLVLQALSAVLQENRNLTPPATCCAIPAGPWGNCARMRDKGNP